MKERRVSSMESFSFLSLQITDVMSPDPIDSLIYLKQNAGMRKNSKDEHTAEESSKLLKASLKRKPGKDVPTPTLSSSDDDNGYDAESPLVKKAKRMKTSKQLKQAAYQPPHRSTKIAVGGPVNVRPKSAMVQQTHDPWKPPISHPAVKHFQPSNSLAAEDNSPWQGILPSTTTTSNIRNLQQVTDSSGTSTLYNCHPKIQLPNPEHRPVEARRIAPLPVQQDHRTILIRAPKISGFNAVGSKGHYSRPNVVSGQVVAARAKRSMSNTGRNQKAVIEVVIPNAGRTIECHPFQSALQRKDEETSPKTQTATTASSCLRTGIC